MKFIALAALVAPVSADVRVPIHVADLPKIHYEKKPVGKSQETTCQQQEAWCTAMTHHGDAYNGTIGSRNRSVYYGGWIIDRDIVHYFAGKYCDGGHYNAVYNVSDGYTCWWGKRYIDCRNSTKGEICAACVPRLDCQTREGWGTCSIGNECLGCARVNLDYQSNDLRDLPLPSSTRCWAECLSEARCAAWTYKKVNSQCFLKSSTDGGDKVLPGIISGVKTCPRDVTLVGGTSLLGWDVHVNNAPVCGDKWDDQAAQIVCRMFGYVLLDWVVSRSGDAVSNFSMYNVQCTGDEAHIKHCTYKRNSHCEGGTRVRVNCFVNCKHVDFGASCAACNGQAGGDCTTRDGPGICRYEKKCLIDCELFDSRTTCFACSGNKGKGCVGRKGSGICYRGRCVPVGSCIAGSMEMLFSDSTTVSVEHLKKGDKIQGIAGENMLSRDDCEVLAVHKVRDMAPTIDHFTADHFIVRDGDNAVVPYGNGFNGSIKRNESVYTLTTTCDAVVNAAGVRVTSFSSVFCGSEIGWKETIQLTSILRDVLGMAPWLDLTMYRNTDTGAWTSLLQPLCDAMLKCLKPEVCYNSDCEECKDVEVVSGAFIRDHVDAESYAGIRQCRRDPTACGRMCVALVRRNRLATSTRASVAGEFQL
eukprot:GEMP01009930.1.p1 GENE.GEMP01009930.1~~GEMP01009930.1.p1  ORF type:complete len:643 (+),score=105.20 GEMP01009930.1:135-2063(+)